MRIGRVTIFDDVYSIVHFLYGIVAGILEPISMTIIYVAYQYWEKEGIKNKLGDFIEYAMGLTIGVALKLIIFECRY